MIGNTADNNTFFGLNSGLNTTINLSNVGIGYGALQLNTTGFSNTAV